MTLTLSRIEAMAPGQEALKAANKLLKPGLWPSRGQDHALGIIWGECQGSASAPYRLSLALEDFGHRCSCPSRKFPCKHVLALAWLYVDRAGEFSATAPPDWVRDWLARRRPAQAASAEAAAAKRKTSASAALAGEAETPAAERDPKAEARAAEQRERLRAARETAIAAGLDELDRWIGDQLDRGIAGFTGSAADQCRIASQRLVDAKAPGLAGMVDDLAAAVFRIAEEQRPSFVLERLGQLHLIADAYRRQDELPEPLRADLRRLVGWTQTREELLSDSATLRVKALWRVTGTLSEVQPDKLRRTETWLLRLSGDGPEFALLLDFSPVSAGTTAPPFAPGECFEAELAFYPSAAPLRAVVAERGAGATAPFTGVVQRSLPQALDAYDGVLQRLPWLQRWPIACVEAVVAADGEGFALADRALTAALPLDAVQAEALVPLAGLAPIAAVALWDGREARLLAAETPLGDWAAP